MGSQRMFVQGKETTPSLTRSTLVTRFGPVSPNRAVDFLKQVCNSLADAHHHGLIHRDIKPSNIYVCRLGIQYDFVKVLDFGLVKLDHSASDQETQLTREGLTTGTPAYLSPEVALGQGKVDARTDIYSLGCVAYWLVTGQRVFARRPCKSFWTIFRPRPFHLRNAPNWRFPCHWKTLLCPAWRRNRRIGRRRLWSWEKDWLVVRFVNPGLRRMPDTGGT